jgi:uncharacterized membrane protein (UPF0127 family)
VRYVQVWNPDRHAILGTRVGVADGWWHRLVGLSGRRELATGEGLLLRPCRAVHMFRMRFPLDVAFLDTCGRVVALYGRLTPGARTRWHRDAADALELPAGTFAATGTAEGDMVVCTEEVVA